MSTQICSLIRMFSWDSLQRLPGTKEIHYQHVKYVHDFPFPRIAGKINRGCHHCYCNAPQSLLRKVEVWSHQYVHSKTNPVIPSICYHLKNSLFRQMSWYTLDFIVFSLHRASLTFKDNWYPSSYFLLYAQMRDFCYQTCYGDKVNASTLCGEEGCTVKSIIVWDMPVVRQKMSFQPEDE